MIYTPMTLRALRLAYNAHSGQVDKANVPYIFHPYHLAEQMDDEISCAVALLHDVVEDTYVNIEALQADFSKDVTDAVSLLTHEGGVDYFDYVEKIKTNPIARKVKLADLAHNSDETRFADVEISPEKMKRSREKYARAKQILLEQVCKII